VHLLLLLLLPLLLLLLQASAEQMTGQEVTVRGWVRTVRQQKQFAFMQVRVAGGMA